MPRSVRIAVSACFFVAILALVALWLRSLIIVDAAGTALPAEHMLIVTSSQGEFEFTFEGLPPNYAGPRFGIESMRIPNALGNRPQPLPLPDKFHWERTPNGFRANTPIWLWMLLATLAALTTWRQTLWSNLRRFSLRTLLITTTLIALLLGLFVWLA
jgi:hypothetical protein